MITEPVLYEIPIEGRFMGCEPIERARQRFPLTNPLRPMGQERTAVHQ